MSKIRCGLKQGFVLIRLVLTALASLPLALVVCMVMFTVVVEGDSPAGPGANIGGGRRR